MASFAAHASQGHIGRARGLARDEETRSRRAEVLKVPRMMTSITDAYAMAHDLRTVAEEDAKRRNQERNETENAEMLAAYGQGAEGVPANRVRTLANKAMSDLAKTQTQRASRSVRDELDRYFVDFLGYYRDVLMLQLGINADLINVDLRPALEQSAQVDDAVMTMRRIDAITAARAQLEGNVPPALVCESLLVQLLHPVG